MKEYKRNKNADTLVDGIRRRDGKGTLKGKNKLARRLWRNTLRNRLAYDHMHGNSEKVKVTRMKRSVEIKRWFGKKYQRIICFLKKRHDISELIASGADRHQYYKRGPGYVCKHCRKIVFVNKAA